MKKFKLNLNEIKVESFETGSSQKENGTVKGHQPKNDNDDLKTQTNNFKTCGIPCDIPSDEASECMTSQCLCTWENDTCVYSCHGGCTGYSCMC